MQQSLSVSKNYLLCYLCFPLHADACRKRFLIDRLCSHKILRSDADRLIYDDLIVILPACQGSFDDVSDITGKIFFRNDALLQRQ